MNNTPPCEQGRDSSVLDCSNHIDQLPSTHNTGIEPGTKAIRTHAHLRLVVSRDDLPDDPLRYAQSKSGRASSHDTLPSLARSKRTAKDSLHLRAPYATLRKWPGVVSQSSASVTRSSGLKDCQKVFRSMTYYHHTVIGKSTPFVEFTNWCMPTDNMAMEIPDYPTIRRANLRRFIDEQFDGNNSAMARCYNPKNPKPSYFIDLFRKNKKGKWVKSFGATAARQIEARAGLKLGQLDIPNSPLEMEDVSEELLNRQILEIAGDMSLDEKQLLVMAAREIKRNHMSKKSA